MPTTRQSGSVAGDWRRAAQGCAAAASQTGCLPSRRAEPRSRCCPYRSQQTTGRHVAWSYSGNPYPHPNPSPDGRGAEAACPDFPQDQLTHGNEAPKWQRDRGLAESGTGMCRGGESDRDVCRAEEPISGHAAALTEASKPPAGTLPGRIRGNRTLTPTPLRTGEGLEAARPDCPQDQLTHGDDAAEAAAWPGIGGERHRDVPRRRVRQDVCRAEEPSPGRAAAPTDAEKPPAGTLPGRIRGNRTLTPTPLPTGEGLEAPLLPFGVQRLPTVSHLW